MGVAVPLGPFLRLPAELVDFRPRLADFAGVEGRDAGELWREDRAVGDPRSLEASVAYFGFCIGLRADREVRGVSDSSGSESLGGALFFLK